MTATFKQALKVDNFVMSYLIIVGTKKVTGFIFIHLKSMAWVFSLEVGTGNAMYLPTTKR